MSDSNGGARAERWLETLGDASREALAEERGSEAHADIARGLDALAGALGEDGPEPPPDPGLPEDYRVLGVLGRGGAGVVYRAHQASLDRDVAVKVLFSAGDPRVVARLQAEAKRLAALEHPGIVRVYEVGRAQAGVYLSLELQPGGSLQEQLRAGPLRPGHAARLVRQVAEALAYTHERGVVHLDLKPGNVLLDAHGDARVADFGLARELAGPGGVTDARASGGATTRGLLGTPEYMAPEQAEDRRAELGERTDVYGLGALLYACLAGRPPFRGESLAEVLHAVRFDEPERLERAAPGAPRDLAAIATVALAKDPARRYPTARALAEDLARYEAGEAVRARPPGALGRAVRAARRHGRELFIATVAVLLTAAAFVPFTGSETPQAGWLRAAALLVDRGDRVSATLLLDELEADVTLSRADARVAGDLRARIDPPRAEDPVAEDSVAEDSVAEDSVAEDSVAEEGAAADLAARAASGSGGPELGLRIDTWIVMDDGAHERLWSGTGRGAVGDRVRIEGTGFFGLPFPDNRWGFDPLRIGTPVSHSRPTWVGRVEAEGVLTASGDDVLWRTDDREVWLNLGRHATSTFVDLASDGALLVEPGASEPCLLEAQRYRWRGLAPSGCTVLMFAEAYDVAAEGERPRGRDLAEWTACLRASVSAAAASDALGDTPERRAALVDRVIALALLGEDAATPPLSALIERLHARGLAPATLTDGVFERGRFSGVTRTGADLGEWLSLARAAVAPGPVIDQLPRSASMSHLPSRMPRGKEWLGVAYILLGALLLAGAYSSVGGDAARFSNLGGALILLHAALDKHVMTPLGSVALDPLACALLALLLRRFARWAGAPARLAAGAFAVAAVQCVLVELREWVELPYLAHLRLPLALALAATAACAARLAPTQAVRITAVTLGVLLMAAFALGTWDRLGFHVASEMSRAVGITAMAAGLSISILTGLAAIARSRVG